MKGKPLESFKVRVAKPVAESGVRPLTFAPCLACGKAISDGYYGRFGDGGVCSKRCNDTESKKTSTHSSRGGEVESASV